MSEQVRQKIEEYYDYTLPFYKLFWHGETRALHYGIWDEKTRTLNEALLNTNKVIAERAQISQDDIVLDAGCGVGGSAFWIAEHTGAYVYGITVSKLQLEKAQELKLRKNISEKIDFSQQSYFDTNFPQNSFTVVWGIESVCHAHHDIDRLLQELFRVLKPGGRLVVADGFRGRDVLSVRQEQDFKIFCSGLALEKLITQSAFSSALSRNGFINVTFDDVTESILPTTRIMRRRCLLGYPLALLTSFLHITPSLIVLNNKAGIVQAKLARERSIVYGIVYAEKPRE